MTVEMMFEYDARFIERPEFTEVGGGFTLRTQPGVRGPEDMAYAAIYFREDPYEAHGWGYGATPADAELVARSRWPEGAVPQPTIEPASAPTTKEQL